MVGVMVFVVEYRGVGCAPEAAADAYNSYHLIEPETPSWRHGAALSWNNSDAQAAIADLKGRCYTWKLTQLFGTPMKPCLSSTRRNARMKAPQFIAIYVVSSSSLA